MLGRPPTRPAEWPWNNEFFYIFFLSRFCKKIYGPLEILQNYTSGAVAHGVRDLTPWPDAVSHGVRFLTPWATALRAYCQVAACPQVTPQTTTVCMDLPPCAVAVGFLKH
jgi:hypothetical protein